MRKGSVKGDGGGWVLLLLLTVVVLYLALSIGAEGSSNGALWASFRSFVLGLSF